MNSTLYWVLGSVAPGRFFKSFVSRCVQECYITSFFDGIEKKASFQVLGAHELVLTCARGPWLVRKHKELRARRGRFGLGHERDRPVVCSLCGARPHPPCLTSGDRVAGPLSHSIVEKHCSALAVARC